MKIYQTLLFACVVTFAVAFGAGCGTMLGSTASPQSLPVVFSSATTNDCNSVAWLKFAQQLNQEVNPTQTEMPIDALLGATIALVSTLAGWYTRHTAAMAQDKISVAIAAIAAGKPSQNPPAS